MPILAFTRGKNPNIDRSNYFYRLWTGPAPIYLIGLPVQKQLGCQIVLFCVVSVFSFCSFHSLLGPPPRSNKYYSSSFRIFYFCAFIIMFINPCPIAASVFFLDQFVFDVKQNLKTNVGASPIAAGAFFSSTNSIKQKVTFLLN